MTKTKISTPAQAHPFPGIQRGTLVMRYPKIVRNAADARRMKLVCGCTKCHEPVQVEPAAFNKGRCPSCHN